jgi:chromosome segregation ATPase
MSMPRNVNWRIKRYELTIDVIKRRLQEQAHVEQQLKSQLEAKQEIQLQREETFASLQEEVDVKTKKLKKLWSKFQAAKNEQQDLQDEFRNEREDLLDTLRELSRELALKLSIIDNFIPEEDRVKIEKTAYYDEETEEWILRRSHKSSSSSPQMRVISRPVSLPTLHRPTSQFAKSMMSAQTTNTRYISENIVTFPLDLPERTTMDMEAIRVDEDEDDGIQGALEYALNGDEEDVIEVESSRRSSRRMK